jgi:prepilin-type N-terminal cleavage/methylation domain-containing protein
MASSENPSARNSAGFTLIEILVALVILSFVALGIAGLFTHAVKTNASGHDYALLATEARFALETLQALPFDHADLTAADSPHTMAPVNPDFTITYTIEDYDIQNWQQASAGSWTPASTPGDANVKRISMTVASTNQILEGRRIFTVSSLKIPG